MKVGANQMRFEFATANRIIFGAGTVTEVGSIASQMGQRALIVSGKSIERAQLVISQLDDKRMQWELFQVAAEPTTESVMEGVKTARSFQADLVIGIGGGSVLDTGKVIAALLTNQGELMDYLEVIGKGRQLEKRSVPYIAIPTTAGTGTEVTRNAVITSPEHRVKVSMRSPFMLPELAIVDPELTYSLPPSVTASTGLDALTQLIEPYVSIGANPLTDTICREGMKRVARSLVVAFRDGNNVAAREGMSLASLFGGLALANAKLGIVHGIAGVIGGMIPAAHGVLCARLLPFVMEMNLKALRLRDPGSPAIERYTEIAQILTGNPVGKAEDGIDWIFNLCREMNIPTLCDLQFSEKDIPAVVEKSQKASSTKGNPIKLTDEEICEIISKAL
jgi:alcohol dehydrogenase class IV